MSGAMSRNKGQVAEREFARELVKLFAEHGLVASAVRTAPLQASAMRGLLPTNVSAADVTCDLLPDDHVECKRQELVRMREWCEQAQADALPGQRWLVAWRQNRQPWRVTLPLRHLHALPLAHPSPLVTLTLADFVAIRAHEQAEHAAAVDRLKTRLEEAA